MKISYEARRSGSTHLETFEADLFKLSSADILVFGELTESRDMSLLVNEVCQTGKDILGFFYQPGFTDRYGSDRKATIKRIEIRQHNDFVGNQARIKYAVLGAYDIADFDVSTALIAFVEAQIALDTSEELVAGKLPVAKK